MPKQVSIGVKLEADNKQFVSSIGLSSKELSKMQKRANKAGGSIKKLGGNFASLGNALRVGAIALYIRQLTELTDANKRMAGQLSLVTNSSEELANVQAKLVDLANSTRTALEPTVQLYARLARNTTALNLNQTDLLQLTESVNKSLQIAGATTREAAAGVIQFSQGLASGRLSGDEFRSVVENMPRLARAIADGLGKDISQLRRLSREGKLTAELLTGAIASQRDKIESEYAKLPKRVEQSMTQLQNNLIAAFSDVDTSNITGAIDDITEAVGSKEFKEGMTLFATFTGDSIKYLVDNADVIIKVGGAFAGLKLGASIGRIGGAYGVTAGSILGAVSGYLTASEALESATEPLSDKITAAYSEVAKARERFERASEQGSSQRYIDGLNVKLQVANDKFRLLLQQQAKINKDFSSPEGTITGNSASKFAKSELANDQDKARKPLDQLLESLKAQNDAFGKGKNGLIEYNLEFGKYKDNVSTLNQLVKEGETKRTPNASDEGAILKNQILQQTREIEAKKLSAKLDKEAAAIQLSLLTPLQSFNKEKERLNVLLKASAISQETYNKALASYKRNLIETNPLLKEAQSIYLATLTPIQKYVKEVENLNKLLNAGAFDNAGGIDTYNRAIDEAKDKLRDLNDAANEFAIEAAGNIQSAFADFLFDPFSEGLDGMLLGFVNVLRRMASEAIAAQLSVKLLGGEFKDTGKIGGTLGGLAQDFGLGSLGGLFEDKKQAFGADNLPTGGALDSGAQGIIAAVTDSGNLTVARTITQSAADALVGSTATNLGALTTQTAIAAQTTALVASGTANTSAIVAAISASNATSALSSSAGGASSLLSVVNTLPTFHTGGISPKEQLAVLLKNEEVLTTGDPRHSQNSQSNAPQENSGTRIINVIDPALVKDYMSSSSGEKVIMNIIQRNAGQVKQVLA